MRWFVFTLFLICIPSLSAYGEYNAHFDSIFENITNLTIDSETIDIKNLITYNNNPIFNDVKFSLFELQEIPIIGPNAEVYKYYSINLSDIWKDSISKSEVKFIVKADWVAENNIGEIHLYRYNQKWFELETSVISENEYIIFLEATTPSLGYLAIVGDTIKNNDSETEIEDIVENSVIDTNTSGIENVVDPVLIDNETDDSMKAEEKLENIPEENQKFKNIMGIISSIFFLLLTLLLAYKFNRKRIDNVITQWRIQREGIKIPEHNDNIDGILGELGKAITDKKMEDSELHYSKLKALYKVMDKKEKARYFDIMHTQFLKLSDLHKELEEEKKGEEAKEKESESEAKEEKKKDTSEGDEKKDGESKESS